MVEKEDNPYEAPKTSDFEQYEKNERAIVIEKLLQITLFIFMLAFIFFLIFPVTSMSGLIISFLKDMGYEMSIKDEGNALMLFFTILMSLFIIIYLFFCDFSMKLLRKHFQAA